MRRSNGGAGRSYAESTAVGKPRARVLIVDDEYDSGGALQVALQGEGYDASVESSARGALAKVANETFDLVLADVSMPEMNGLELCRQLVARQPGLPVVMVTGRGDMDMVVAALRLGARDFLTKPVDVLALRASITSILHPGPRDEPCLRASRLILDPAPTAGMPALLGQSPESLRVTALIRALSGSLASVLLHGETGSGKEVIARALHASSQRRNGPFVSVNCAAIPCGLLESELFGHARGAFTEARVARIGLLAQANGGTLLLDEIGELPLALQPKLLRALQERRVRPVGQNSEVPFDCRIIAASNRDLEREVAERRFREDLYYRISVIPIRVPPLRDRGNDILLLAEHFLGRFGKERRLTLSAVTKEKLLAYRWPGNVRELENCLERGVALARTDVLGLEDLPERIQVAGVRPGAVAATACDDADTPVLSSLFEFERVHILKTVELLHGDKALAAELLGIDRRTLRRRLEQYRA